MMESHLSRTFLIRRAILSGALALAGISASAQTPSTAVVVTVRNAKALAIVDPLTMKMAGTIPIRDGLPHELTVSADGKLAFVTLNPKGGNDGEPVQPGYAISVIDLSAQKELRRVEIGPGSTPHGIVFVGGKVYYTAEGYRLIGRYDPALNQIDWMQGTAQIRTHQILVTKDTNKIITANTGSNTVTVMVKGELPPDYQKMDYDSPPAWNVTHIPVRSGPEGIALSPDEKEVWVATRNDGGLSIVDLAAKKVTQTLKISNAPGPSTPAFTPNGERVLIADNAGGDVVVLDAAARKEVRRIKAVGHEPHAILISPDGARAYVANERANDVAVIDLKTLEIIGRVVTGDQPEKMAWVERK
jgi:YVTN family beta-propeller protein